VCDSGGKIQMIVVGEEVGLGLELGICQQSPRYHPQTCRLSLLRPFLRSVVVLAVGEDPMEGDGQR
jgi:hypothetical protein